MDLPMSGIATRESWIRVPLADVELVHIDLPTRLHHRLHVGPGYRLDMSLGARSGNPRVQYRSRWQSHRYEKVGDLFLLSGREQVYGTSEPAKGAALVCNMAPAAISAWFEDEIDWTDHQLLAALDIGDLAIQGLMARLLRELRHPGFASDTLVELIAAQLAIELCRFCTNVLPAKAIGGLAPWQLRMIDERLAASLSDVSIADLAKLCRVSPRHLSRAYRTSRGGSIGQHIANLRIAEAKRRLVDGESVKAISNRVGFGSASSFSFAFRRATGASPVAFRNSMF